MVRLTLEWGMLWKPTVTQATKSYWKDKGFSEQGSAECWPPEVSPAWAVFPCACPHPEMSSVPLNRAHPSAMTPEHVYQPVSTPPGTSDRSREWLVTGLRWAEVGHYLIFNVRIVPDEVLEGYWGIPGVILVVDAATVPLRIPVFGHSQRVPTG